jgi:Leucine-rich repeat (LRR) protein
MKLKELSCFRTDGDKMVNLKKLNLLENELTSADDLLSLRNLTHLNLSNNKIKKLFTESITSEEVSQKSLFLLEYLSLSYNQIQEVSDLSFQYLPNIKVLHLQSNKISKVLLFLLTKC